MLNERMSQVSQRGLTVVELLVGVAIGLLVVVGAIKLAVDHLTDSRRVLVETRLSQDLRSAADIVARDVRRSGYWQGALSGVVYPAASNPYRTVTPMAGSASSITYFYSRDTTENNVVNTTSGQPNETFGFRLLNGALESQTDAGTWQQLTDPSTAQITSFNIVPAHQELSLGQYCSPVCALGSPGCPSVIVRRFDITLIGNAPAPNTNVQRRVDISVRPRNDEITVPNCPL
jgi:prepilin peptidase dependent protein B